MYDEGFWSDSEEGSAPRNKSARPSANIIEAPSRSYIDYFSSFAKSACGVDSVKKCFHTRQFKGPGFHAAICRAPEIKRLNNQGGDAIEVVNDICAAAVAKTPSAAKAQAAKLVLQDLVAKGFLHVETGEPTDKVLRREVRAKLPDGSLVRLPLEINDAAVVDMPRLTLPDDHKLHHIFDKAQLPDGEASLYAALGILQDGEAEAVVGFDIEWQPEMGKVKDIGHSPVSVLQVSSGKATVIVNLLALGEGEGPTLRCQDALNHVAGFFTNKAITKVGLHCNDDVKRISSLVRGGRVDPVVELKDLAGNQEGGLGFQKLGLRSLVSAALEKRLDKTEQCSDWQTMKLPERMVAYAATDAYATIQVYRRLKLIHDHMINEDLKRPQEPLPLHVTLANLLRRRQYAIVDGLDSAFVAKEVAMQGRA